MERGKIHASPQSYSVKGKEHDSLSAAFISPSLSFFSLFWANLRTIPDVGIEPFTHFSITCPHIGENCMCESATIVCIVCARMRAAKHDGEDDLIAHLRGILHIFDFQARTY